MRHGTPGAGVEGHSYPPGPSVSADPTGAWLRGRVTRANEAEARRIWSLIDQGYSPIDWQLDYKSGYRWSDMTRSQDVAYGVVPGADVKVPWELARMQHLPQLALAAVQDPVRAGQFAREFRNEILDFTATNPPRFGVNWVMTMEVAIRVVNWLVAYDLFRASGTAFDDDFETILARSVLAHGKHIVENLEWSPTLRANHYLADVVGLLFAAAWLPRTPQTDAWLAFSAGEVVAEADAQFLPDGGNFEASTCYHRLSGELAVCGLAMILGLTERERSSIRAADARQLPWLVRRLGRPIPAGVLDGTLPPALVDCLERAAEFTMDMTKPDGRIVQIGDNDSGQFLKLLPTDKAAESPLDHRHLVGAIHGLVPREDFAAFAGPWAAEGMIVRALAGGTTATASRQGPSAATGSRIPGHRAVSSDPHATDDAPTFVILLGDGARTGLRTFAYPDFGAFGYRSDRIQLIIRCGPVGQHGVGGHAHNDQLAIELTVDGQPWIRDPGTYLYTASPEARNRYRSSRGHFAPRLAGGEPARLDLGLFELERGTHAVCLSFDENEFLGVVRYPRGRSVTGRYRLDEERLLVWWSFEGCEPDPALAHATWRDWLPEVPFSPGYGLRETSAP